MRICVLWLVFSVAFASERNSGCYTPAGEYGTCIPVESCSEFTKRLDNGALTYDRHLLCGQDDDGPLICCGSTGRVESTTQKPDVTVIPTRRSPALATAGTLQRATIPANRNPYCVTPNGENGNCIPLTSCLPIRTSMANMEFIRKSNCGYDKQPALVCCGSVGQFIEPAASPPRTTVVAPIQTAPPSPNLRENASCYTPNLENGTCISIRSCSSLLQYVIKKGNQNEEFLRKSQCGGSVKWPLVCCKSEKTARPSINSNNIHLKPNSPCVTPNNEEGVCKPYSDCKSIYEPVLRKEKGAEAFAVHSQCGSEKYEHEALVCCSDRPPNQVNLSSSSISLSQNESHITPNRPSNNSKNVIDLKPNSRCVTPSSEEGICQPFLSCRTIQDLISGKEKESIAFAIKSRCGFENGPLVCCSNRPPNQLKLPQVQHAHQ